MNLFTTRLLTTVFGVALIGGLVCAVLGHTTATAWFLLLIGSIQLLWKRGLERAYFALSSLNDEALARYHLARARCGRMHEVYGESMWGIVCVLTNLYEMTPRQAHDHIVRAQNTWQNKHPVN